MVRFRARNYSILQSLPYHLRHLFREANSFDGIFFDVSFVGYGGAGRSVRITSWNVIPIQNLACLKEPVKKARLGLFDNHYIYIALLEVASCTELSAASQELCDG